MHIGAPILASVAALREAAKQKVRMAKLYFYYAAMNAGKSTTLLQADYNYRERGMETMLWTARLDDRAGEGTIGSRIALSAPAHSYDENIDLFEEIAEELKKRTLDCILVDEAQFLTQRHVLQLCEVADRLSIPVLCYGLRTDFQAKLFPGSAALLALADVLIELKAVCECGRKATMNLRVDAEGHAVAAGAQTEIGGNDRYVALCRRHFFERLREGEERQLNLGLARR
jgi:thymidine kinase